MCSSFVLTDFINLIPIDGVAPKAKMNQQRARRYKSTRDRELAEIRRREQREAFFNEYPEYKDKIIGWPCYFI